MLKSFSDQRTSSMAFQIKFKAVTHEWHAAMLQQLTSAFQHHVCNPKCQVKSLLEKLIPLHFDASCRIPYLCMKHNCSEGLRYLLERDVTVTDPEGTFNNAQACDFMATGELAQHAGLPLLQCALDKGVDLHNANLMLVGVLYDSLEALQTLVGFLQEGPMKHITIERENADHDKGKHVIAITRDTDYCLIHCITTSLSKGGVTSSSHHHTSPHHHHTRHHNITLHSITPSHHHSIMPP